MVLPFVPLSVGRVVRTCFAGLPLRIGWQPPKIGNSPRSRRVCGAALIIGNVAVQAVRSPAPARWPGGWRQLGKVGRMPFRAVTLKVADEPNGLSTMLAMYYLPGRKAEVIGRGVALDELPFETVSRQQPMFIHNFGCEGVGHDDTVSVPGVGCLLMAPPSMTVGTSYPFNRTFLFVRYDRMTPREPAGRWNTQPTLNLRLTADPQRVPLDREMYVNLLVTPSVGRIRCV